MSNESSAEAERTGPRAEPGGGGVYPDAVRSGELARLLIESVRDYAIYALDADGRVVDWPESARRIKGYSAEEVLGRHFSLFYTAHAVEAGEPELALRTAEREGRWESEGWRVRSGGDVFWANVVITPLRDAGGRMVGFGKVTRDLTERKKSADALAKREKLLALAQEITRLGSWELDLATGEVGWSQGLLRVFGVEGSGLAGRFDAYLDRVHPEDRPRVERAVEAAKRVPGGLQLEHRIVRADGAVRDVSVNGAVVREGDAPAGRLVGTTRDITEEKRAEADARRLLQEQAARAAAEAAERRSRFVAEVSRVLASSLDFETTLQQVAELAIPELADWCAVDLVAGGGGIERVAVAHPDPDAAEQVRRARDRYAPDPLAEVGAARAARTGEATLVAEVTDAFLVELARDEEQLRLLRELGLRSYMAVPLEARGKRLGAMTFMTAASGRRYDPMDLMVAEDVGRRAALAIDNARLFGEAEEARARFEAQTVELEEQADALRTQAAELEETQVELELANDELHHINEHLREKTEEAEAARAEAEAARAEAERANEAKSHFLATMSHELRTPLNAIAGYTELLELGIRGPLTEEQRRDLERIRRNQVHLLGLINDVLNFARIEAGQVHYRIEPVVVDAALVETESLIGPQVRAKQLEYHRRAGDRAVRVMADPERLQQIVLNLLTNAVKFTPERGVIELDWEADAEKVRIRVRDTGIGIAADRLETIFEPFIQVSRDRISDTEGVGLGLAISRDLARAMDGELVVTSEVGVGSTFVLTLPRGPDRSEG